MGQNKVLIAAGGTGGHLFPAQALAQELVGSQIVENVLFAGHGLAENRYFRRDLFSFADISGASPFGGSILKLLKAGIVIGRGIASALRLLSTYKPSVVVGFGSFHAFPVLTAAWLKKIPIILFESNSVPGKVNRLFSKKAIFTGIQFSEAACSLKGATAVVEMPIWSPMILEEACEKEIENYFKLSADKATLLVFGGSQGAISINRQVCNAVRRVSTQTDLPLQVIHIAGTPFEAQEVLSSYASYGISVYVKPFEDRMSLAWKAADLAICRAGAATLSELIHYEVPAILVPYPFATDNHQQKNAEFMQTVIGAAKIIAESELDPERLATKIHEALLQRSQMQVNIQNYKKGQRRTSLASLIKEIINHEHR